MMRRHTIVLLIAACAFALAVVMLLPSLLTPSPVEAYTSTQPRVQVIDTLEPPPPTAPPVDDGGAQPSATPATGCCPIYIVPPAGSGGALGTLPTAPAAGGGAQSTAGGERAQRAGFTSVGLLTTPTQKAVYTFSGTAGQTVKITVVKTSGDLDTFLELYDSNYPSGPRLAYNDGNPAAGGLNSQIDRFRLPSSGVYKVVVSSYAGRSTGAYRLTVSQLEQSSPTPSSTPTPRAQGCGGAGVLRIGVPVAGAVRTPTERCIYTYSGTAGDTVTITLVATSGNLDTYLELYDPSGVRLAYNDNNQAAGGRNSQINRYRLPSSGVYYIGVSSYAGKSTGLFALMVSRP
jgi:hypothetical protein